MPLKLYLKVQSFVVLILSCFALEDIRAQENSEKDFKADLKAEDLQAIHEARLRFEGERKVPSPAHGIYEDFRAIFVPLPTHLDHNAEQKVITAARQAGVQIIFLAESAKEAKELESSKESILVIRGRKVEDFLFFSNGSAGNGNHLQFLVNPFPHKEITNATITGLELVNTRAGVEIFAKAIKEPRLKDSLRTFPAEAFGVMPNAPKQIFAEWDKTLAAKALVGIGVNEIPTSSLVLTNMGGYELSFGNLATHILSTELSEKAVRQALANGHAYVAHDWLCDPTGFIFGAINNLGVFGMGDSAPMLGTTRISCISPLPARLRLIHKGEVIQESLGANLTYQAKEAGPYRLEAWLDIAGKERPWIYSNPVYLRQPGPSETRLPSSGPTESVLASKNLNYRDGAEEDSGKHKLDIYSPKGQSNAPVLFFIHGGAWKSGDRSLYGPLGNRFARAGFVTVAPSYRLAPKHPHPAQIEDVAAAFAWTVKHVSEYGGDMNHIYVAGHSAGGHLAALLALDERHLAPYQLSPRLIRGVLALSGVYNLTFGESQESVFGKDPESRRDASPLFHIRPDAPPFLITFCEWDYFSLPAQARQFHRALQKAGVRSELVLIPRESHISEIINVVREDDPTAIAALRFMKRKD